MHPYKFLWLITILLTANEIWANVLSAAETRLANFLLNSTRYSPDVRPVSKYEDTLIVRHGLTLIQLIKLDEKSQIITTRVLLQIKWDDMLLKWDPAKYDGITEINVDVNLIWIPHIELFNNADDSLDTIAVPRAVVRFNGTVSAVFPKIMKSTCQIRVRDFPFDQQICELRFGSFRFDTKQMNLQPLSGRVKVLNGRAKYKENGEWNLINEKIVQGTVLHAFSNESLFSQLSYKLLLRRKPLYYIANFLIPCVLIALITILLFLIPADTGEQMAVGVTILLSMAVFFLLLEDKMPETSDNVPLIGKYFACTIVQISLAVGAICMLLCFHHHEATEVPLWMKKYILIKLAHLLRIRTSENEYHGGARRGTIMQRLRKSNRQVRRTDNFATEIGRNHLLIWQAKAKAKRLRREKTEKDELGSENKKQGTKIMKGGKERPSIAVLSIKKGKKDAENAKFVERSKKEEASDEKGKFKEKSSERQKNNNEIVRKKSVIKKKESNDRKTSNVQEVRKESNGKEELKLENTERRSKTKEKESNEMTEKDARRREGKKDDSRGNIEKKSKEVEEDDGKKKRKRSESSERSKKEKEDATRSVRRKEKNGGEENNANEKKRDKKEKKKEEERGNRNVRREKEEHKRREEKMVKDENVTQRKENRKISGEERDVKGSNVKEREKKKEEKGGDKKEAKKESKKTDSKDGKSQKEDVKKKGKDKNKLEDGMQGKEKTIVEQKKNEKEFGKELKKDNLQTKKANEDETKDESKKEEKREKAVKVGAWTKLENEVDKTKRNLKKGHGWKKDTAKKTVDEMHLNAKSKKDGESKKMNDDNSQKWKIHDIEDGNDEEAQKQLSNEDKGSEKKVQDTNENATFVEEFNKKALNFDAEMGSTSSIRSCEDEAHSLVPSTKLTALTKRNAARQFKLVDRVVRIKETLTQKLQASKTQVKLDVTPQPTAMQRSAKKLENATNWAEAEHESVKLMAHKIQETEVADQLKRKWKEVGKVLNNLLMWLYIISIILAFFVFFGPIFIAADSEIY